jgi:Fe-S cluster biogenesis protein NfuA
MAVNIQLEWTPNPSTLKYVVDRQLLPSGAVNFTEKAKAEEISPLAKRIFDIRGVVGVMLGTNFVTVTKGDEGDWDELNDGVMETLDEHLTDNRPIVTGEWRAGGGNGGGGEVAERIRAFLEAEIRPAVAQDGGDVLLDRFEDGIAYLMMHGSCSGCPSSVMTLKMGIENRLRELIPEVQEVVAV